MAIGRGSDLAGLAAMPWRLEGGGDVSIVRPLLAVAKADLIDLCRTAGLQWAEDPGNLDPSTVRGALRVEVRPTLERLWPRIALHAAGTAKSLQAVLASVDEQVKQIFGGREVPAMWPRRTLALVPAVVLGRGLRAVALQHDPSLADALGRAVVEPPVAAIRDGERRPRRYNWPGGLEIQVSSRKVELVSC